MNLRIFKIFCLILLLGFFSWTGVWADDSTLPPDIAAIKARGVLRIGIFKQDAPPVAMRDSNGNWVGIEIDLANMIANQLAVKLQIVSAPTYDAMVDMVAKRQIDLAMELAVLPERGLRVAFTHPYYSFNAHLLVNRLQAAKNGWNNVNAIMAGLSSNKEVAVIGALQGSAGAELLQQTYPNIKIVYYPTITQAFQDVMAGKIFAAIGTSPIEVQDFLKTDPRASLLAEDVEVPNSTFLIAIALPWQYYHLRELLDSYLTYLNQNGVIEEIFQKYGESTT